MAEDNSKNQPATITDDDQWNLMYDELLQYKRRYRRTCSVGTSPSSEYHKLSNWVQKQRNCNSMDSRKKKALLDIGFDFDHASTPNKHIFKYGPSRITSSQKMGLTEEPHTSSDQHQKQTRTRSHKTGSKKHPALITPEQLQEKPIAFPKSEELKEDSRSRSKKRGLTESRSMFTNQHQHQAHARSSKTRTARGGPVLIGYPLSCFTPEQLGAMPIAYSSYIDDDDKIEKVAEHSQTEHVQTNTTLCSEIKMLASKVDTMQQQLTVALTEIRNLTSALKATQKDNPNVQRIASEHERHELNLNDDEGDGSKCSDKMPPSFVTLPQAAWVENPADVEYEWIQF